MLNAEEEVELEYKDLDQNINHIEEESSESFLTKTHYQKSEYFDELIYTSSVDIYQAYPKLSYNLRYGANQVPQILKKKVVSPIKQWHDPSLENNRPKGLIKLSSQS